jgi:hypothetical protein
MADGRGNRQEALIAELAARVRRAYAAREAILANRSSTEYEQRAAANVLHEELALYFGASEAFHGRTGPGAPWRLP